MQTRSSIFRTALLISALATSVACRNKANEPDDKPTEEAKPAASASAAPAESKPPEIKKPKRPEKKQLPAPEDVAAPPADATTTASGLAYKILEKGDGGDKPELKDKVSVHYSGWTKDGKMFDSSVTRGRPASFGVTGVIKGWTEGLQLMSKGAKFRFWIPGNLAYGDTPRRPGAPSGQLTFDVELLEILKPPKAPDDVAAPPATAKKTASGLAYRVLEEGEGEAPTTKSRVTVHYSGWTTDGKLFDSSIPRGRPSTFGVTQVIKGWTEGLQLMKKGAKYRFWIPADLAYGEKPGMGKPGGMLVFDVELLEIR